jgi:hypothetical protein
MVTTDIGFALEKQLFLQERRQENMKRLNSATAIKKDTAGKECLKAISNINETL